MKPEKKKPGTNDAGRIGMRPYARGRCYDPDRYGGVTPYQDPGAPIDEEAVEQALAAKEKVAENISGEVTAEELEQVEENTPETVEQPETEEVEETEAEDSEAEEVEEESEAEEDEQSGE